MAEEKTTVRRGATAVSVPAKPSAAESFNASTVQSRSGLSGKRRYGIAGLLVLVVVCVLFVVVKRPLQAVYLRSAARQLASETRIADALATAEHLQQIAPHDPETLMLLCRLQRQTGQLREALETIRRLREAGVSESRIQDERRLTAARSGDLESSERFLPQLLTSTEADPRDVCEAFVIGYRTRFRLSESRALCELWQQDFPKDFRPAAHRGMIEQMETHWGAAVSEYQKAVELGDQRAETLIRLGLCCLEINEPARALESFRLCAELYPKSADAQRGVADALSRSGRAAEACDAYRKCLSLDPYNFDASLGAATILIDRGQPDQALLQLESLVRDWPEDAPALFQYSQALRAVDRLSDAEDAAARWQKADQQVQTMEKLLTTLQSDPGDFALRSRIGVLMMKHYSRTMAVPFLESVLLDNPSDQNATEALAAYFTWRKEPDRASVYRNRVDPASRE